jgi:hypothetical protein
MLRRLGDLARRRNVPLVLYTIAVSLESPPIRPLFAAEISEADRARIKALVRQAGENMAIDDRRSEEYLHEAYRLDKPMPKRFISWVFCRSGGAIMKRRGVFRAGDAAGRRHHARGLCAQSAA